MELKRSLLLLNNRLSRNILFWLLFAFFHYFPRQNIIDYFIILGLCLVFYGIPVYINNLFLINRFLLKRHYLAYAILFSILLGLTIVETLYVNQRAVKILPFLSYTNPFASSNLSFHIFHITLLFSFLALGKFMTDTFQTQRNMELLQQERLENELESLKAQINPHFLFNALNTIYGMARRTDQKTGNAILTLSDILRHNLYESSESYISMEKEIQSIKQYVSFSQLRVHRQDAISLHVESNNDAQRIRPLLLLPFIENAIKHGLEKHPDAWVKVLLNLNNDELVFECINSFVNNTAIKATAHKGIGLKNVKRRLELCYPDRHDLQIKNDHNRFIVLLKIKLS
jgi:two-component system, LytTR family, sensor kinase